MQYTSDRLPPNAQTQNSKCKFDWEIQRRINFLTILLLGILILFISITAYCFTSLIVRGEINVLRMPPQKINWWKRAKQVPVANSTELKSLITVQPITERVGILMPDCSRQENLFFGSVNIVKGAVKELVDFCAKERINFDTISSLTPLITNYGVIILPFNLCLAESTINQLSDYLSNGGGLIVFGDCGIADETGRIRTISFLNRIIGITKQSEFAKPITQYALLTIKANSPLATDIPLGTKIGTVTEFGNVRAKILEVRAIPDGYWFNPFADLGIPMVEIEKSTGLCHGNYNKGRFVWFGFPLTSVTGDSFSQAIKTKLLRNALLWTLQKSLVQIKPWPLNYQAAAIISSHVEQNFRNVSNVLKVLKAQKVKGSFFILASLAESNATLVKKMAAVGEIGVHGYAHTGFKGLPYEVQTQELKKSIKILEKICRKKISGFCPPYGSYDDNTLKAANTNGLNYLVTAIVEGNNLAPNFIRDFDDFIIIPKPNKDDYDIFYRDSIIEPKAVLQELKDDFDRVYDLGGYYALVLHTQILAADSNYLVLARMIDYLKTKRVWLTTWQEITEWWRKMRNLQLVMEEKDKFNIRLTLTNRGKSSAENFKIQIFAPDNSTEIQLETDFKPPLIWDYDSKTKSYEILIKKIKPNSTNHITIKFNFEIAPAAL